MPIAQKINALKNKPLAEFLELDLQESSIDLLTAATISDHKDYFWTITSRILEIQEDTSLLKVEKQQMTVTIHYVPSLSNPNDKEYKFLGKCLGIKEVNQQGISIKITIDDADQWNTYVQLLKELETIIKKPEERVTKKPRVETDLQFSINYSTQNPLTPTIFSPRTPLMPTPAFTPNLDLLTTSGLTPLLTSVINENVTPALPSPISTPSHLTVGQPSFDEMMRTFNSLRHILPSTAPAPRNPINTILNIDSSTTHSSNHREYQLTWNIISQYVAMSNNSLKLYFDTVETQYLNNTMFTQRGFIIVVNQLLPYITDLLDKMQIKISTHNKTIVIITDKKLSELLYSVLDQKKLIHLYFLGLGNIHKTNSEIELDITDQSKWCGFLKFLKELKQVIDDNPNVTPPPKQKSKRKSRNVSKIPEYLVYPVILPVQIPGIQFFALQDNRFTHSHTNQNPNILSSTPNQSSTQTLQSSSASQAHPHYTPFDSSLSLSTSQTGSIHSQPQENTTVANPIDANNNTHQLSVESCEFIKSLSPSEHDHFESLSNTLLPYITIGSNTNLSDYQLKNDKYIVKVSSAECWLNCAVKLIVAQNIVGIKAINHTEKEFEIDRNKWGKYITFLKELKRSPSLDWKSFYTSQLTQPATETATETATATETETETETQINTITSEPKNPDIQAILSLPLTNKSRQFINDFPNKYGLFLSAIIGSLLKLPEELLAELNDFKIRLNFSISRDSQLSTTFSSFISNSTQKRWIGIKALHWNSSKSEIIIMIGNQRKWNDFIDSVFEIKAMKTLHDEHIASSSTINRPGM